MDPFQSRVAPFLVACFGPERPVLERNWRFLEEGLELVQSTGMTASEAHQLVDYVFGRPVGVPHQEVGGTMLSLAALCISARLDMHLAGEDELVRVWSIIPQIQARHAAKPKFSPLPGPRPCAGGLWMVGIDPAFLVHGRSTEGAPGIQLCSICNRTPELHR